MKKITSILNLPDSADEDAIVAAITDLNNQIDDGNKTIAGLKGQIADLKTTASGIPKGIDPAAVKAKIAAGLTKEQAIEVLTNQASADAAAKKGK